MPKGRFAESLIGKTFGRLTVIERVENYISKTGQEAVWKCKCECGKLVNVRAGQLRSGHTKSCGCLSREINKETHKKHGKHGSKLYYVWGSMKDRCYREKCKEYKNYGGRGIRICDEWHYNFDTFDKWAREHGYAEGLSIDRINNDGNYEPGNCRWATPLEQAHNTRRYKGGVKNAKKREKDFGTVYK